MSIRRFTSETMSQDTANKITEVLICNEGNRLRSSKDLEISIRGMRLAIHVIRKKFPELFSKIPEPKHALPNCLKYYR